MKTKTKILILFLFTIVLIFTRVAISQKIQNEIFETSKLIKNVENPLTTMAEEVIGYDGILTSQVYASLLHAQNGEDSKIKEHRDRYEEVGKMLDDILKKEAKILLIQSERTPETRGKVLGYLQMLDDDNTALVDLETKAFDSIGNKDIKNAYSYIMGGDYDRFKANFEQNYSSWVEIEKELSADMEVKLYEKSQQVIYLNLVFSFVSTVLLTMIIFMLRAYMSQPLLEKIKNAK